jgi:hypothetical protein
LSALRPFETLLFWLMAVAGAATVIPALLLPVWFEYLASRDAYAAAEEKLAQLEHRLEAVRRQTYHLTHDAAYILRMAQQDAGALAHAASPAGQGGFVSLQSASPPVLRPGEEWIPELSAYVEQTLARYPRLRVLVRDDTRPMVLMLGVALLVAALLLLGRPSVTDPLTQT